MVFRMTALGKFFTQSTVYGLETLKLVPAGTYDVGEALKKVGFLLRFSWCEKEKLMGGVV